MAGRLLPRMFDVAVDANGAPYPGALMYTYANGTLTPKATYTASALSVPLTNPVVADSAGRFPDIWGDDGQIYRVKLTTAGGVVIFQSDDMIILGQNPTGLISRDFGAGGRFQIYAAAGVANYEGGDPSPDNVGGKVRIGGYAGTQADTAKIDALATTVTGTMAVAGNATFGGAVTLADGSVLSNAASMVLQSGRYYKPDPIVRIVNAAGDTLALTANQIYWIPFSRGVTADAIALNVAGGVGGNMRLGIYTANATTGLPDTLIEQSAVITTGTTGNKVAVFAGAHAVTSRVWLAVFVDSAVIVTSATETTATTRMDGRYFGETTLGSSIYGKYSTLAFAALPNTAAAITGDLTTSIPYVVLRAA